MVDIYVCVCVYVFRREAPTRSGLGVKIMERNGYAWASFQGA